MPRWAILRFVLLLATACLFGCGDSSTQPHSVTTWEVTLDTTYSRYAQCGVRGIDGGFVVAGWATTEPAYAALLVKVDEEGKEVWEHTVSVGSRSLARQITSYGTVGYVLAGNAYESDDTGTDFLAIATDGVGNPLFTHTYGSVDFDEAWSVADGGGGRFLFAGASHPLNVDKVYVVLVDFEGGASWERFYDFPGYNSANAAIATGDGGFIIAGYSSFPDELRSEAFWMRIDAAGDTLWLRHHASLSSQTITDIAQTPDGGFLLAGWGKNSELDMGANVYATKISGTGDIIWEESYDCQGFDMAASIVAVPSGGYAIAGRTASSASSESSDMLLLKIDEAGGQQWWRSFGGDDYDEATSVAVADDGGFFLAGSTVARETGHTTLYLVKTNASGQL